MTPLHLRRRLRAVVTMFAGAVPDDAAEARAVFNTMYDDCDDESIADLMRIATDELRFQRERVDHYKGEADKAEQERDKLRTELADMDEALYAALDIRPDSLQAATMYAPGGVRRLAAERDEAVALISTLRGELAAAVDERDKALDLAREAVAGEVSIAETLARVMGEKATVQTTLADVRRDRDRLYAKQQEDARILVLLWEWTHDAGNQYVPTGGDADTFGDGVRRAQERVQNILSTRRQVADDPPPKRKRTKEERAKVTSAYLANLWTMSPTGMSAAIRREIALMGPSTSRDIATRMWARVSTEPPDESEIRNDMRWVQDFARAGYLTVAKGPGGVRVYGLKEGA